MGHWLAPPGAARVLTTIKRFDARYWTLNFPRPMMASATTTGPNSLRVDAVFYRGRSGGADLGSGGPARPSAARLRDRPRLPAVPAVLPLAQRRAARARRGRRADADDRGAGPSGRRADMVCAAVEPCRGHGRGRRDRDRFRRPCRRLGRRRPRLGGRRRPDVHIAGAGGLCAGRREPGGAGGGLGRAEPDRLRGRGIGAVDGRRDRARARAAHGERL